MSPRLGEPTPRIDARLKVTGAARYPSDAPLAHAVHAYLLTSAIARGRVVRFHLEEARAVWGVLDILTHENVGHLAKPPPPPGGRGRATTTSLESDRIWHDGQIIGVVLAESYEAAREGAHRVRIDYETEPAAAHLDAAGVQVESLAEAEEDHEDPCVGDAERAFALSSVRVDERYETPPQHHNPIELFTTACEWIGDRLTVYESSQFVKGLAANLARQLGMDPRKVRIRSEYVGGAFGSRGSITHRTAWIAIAARRLQRPVKLVATRDQGFTIATYRAETRHHVRLGAGRDGRLQALCHEAWEATSRPSTYNVSGTETTARLYACANVLTRVHIVHLDRNTPGFMRAPPDTPYMFALESAMDELAFALGMDPVDLRRINDTGTEPIKGLPYTSRSLVRCLDEAARAFGWSRRDPRPRSMRSGDWLIGYGCATAAYPANMGVACARVRVEGDHASVQIGAHEIGTGTYTLVALTAADRLGLPLEKITVEGGDSDLPAASLAAGSSHATGVVHAVAQACEALRERRASAAESAAALEAYAESIPRGAPKDGAKRIHEGKAALARGSELADRICYGFGAQFVELRVHAHTGEVRVARATGAFAAGRIMNPLTARSQLLSGMIWGVSAALLEATEIDRTRGRYVNDDLAEYLLPVNADVRQFEALLVPEEDSEVNPLGMKGIGELGIVGMNAAVANAVYHATGRRIRELPIRLEKLL